MKTAFVAFVIYQLKNGTSHFASAAVGNWLFYRVVFLLISNVSKIMKSKSNINWKLFFSGGNTINYERFYKSEINGKRVEKHTFRGGVKYSIGNIDEAKKKFKTELELIQALNNQN